MYAEETMTSTPEAQSIRPGAERMLLDLHIAEDTALTTRSAYYIMIAASLFPGVLVGLTVVATIWNYSNHDFVIWTTTIVVQQQW
jgi:hypothetical protein